MAKVAKTKKTAGVWTQAGVASMAKRMKKRTEEMKKELLETGKMTLYREGGKPNLRYDGHSVPILDGNSKLGAYVKTLSLRPVVDCGNCRFCRKECYDMRHDVIQTSCREYRCATAAILEAQPERFWDEVRERCRYIQFLRYNIGGDIKDEDFLANMVRVAEECPKTQFLAFTKMYGMVNSYLDKSGGYLPDNLHLFFSAWPGAKMDNPYGIPTTFPVYSDEDIEKEDDIRRFMEEMPKFYWHCGDDCTRCALVGEGCWKLGRGESVGFNFH